MRYAVQQGWPPARRSGCYHACSAMDRNSLHRLVAGDACDRDSTQHPTQCSVRAAVPLVAYRAGWQTCAAASVCCARNTEFVTPLLPDRHTVITGYAGTCRQCTALSSSSDDQCINQTGTCRHGSPDCRRPETLRPARDTAGGRVLYTLHWKSCAYPFWPDDCLNPGSFLDWEMRRAYGGAAQGRVDHRHGGYGTSRQADSARVPNTTAAQMQPVCGASRSN